MRPTESKASIPRSVICFNGVGNHHALRPQVCSVKYATTSAMLSVNERGVVGALCTISHKLFIEENPNILV